MTEQTTEPVDAGDSLATGLNDATFQALQHQTACILHAVLQGQKAAAAVPDHSILVVWP